jgi:rifampicin phosphotransferase
MRVIFSNKKDKIPTSDSIGGKAFNLIKMLRSGIPVPDFFIIPADTVSQLLATLASNFEPHNQTDRDAFKKQLEEMDISDAQLQVFMEAIEQITEPGELVSVRSSAALEDGRSNSFAGQFYTELFVNKKSFSKALLKCIASAYSSNVSDYMKIKGMNTSTFPFAIVVQKMVHATRSGIGFSMRPGGNLANMCIVAGYGSGEGVVMEKVETDTYFVNRKNREVQKTVVNKKEKLIYNGQMILHQVEAENRAIPALSDSEIQQVADLLLQTEKILASPSDIEFSIDKDGQLYLLQMRPITTIKPEKIFILDNTNIVESYPGITLPLSFDFAIAAYEKLFRSSASAFWISEEDTAKLSDVFKNLIAHPSGRIYYRLDNWYRMLALVHRSKSSMQDWENAVGLKDSEMEQIVNGYRGKLKFLASAIWLIARYRKGNKTFFSQFDHWYQKLRNFKEYKGKPDALWQHYENYTSHLFRSWHLTIINDFLAFQAFGWTQALLRKAGIVELANDLVSSNDGVESEEAIVEVLRIKDSILENEQLHALFLKSNQEILTSIQNNDFPTFTARFFDYLNRFGDRTLAELKLETPSPRSQPVLFVGMLKQQLQSPMKADVFIEKKRNLRLQALKLKGIHFPFWDPKRIILEFCISLSRYGLKNRENMRFCRVRIYGAVKDIFLEIAEKMNSQGYIEQVNDVFYLNMDEIKSYCTKNEGAQLSKIILTRKKEFETFKSLKLPDRIMYIDELPHFGDSQIEQQETGNQMHGVGVSPGIVVNKAIVVTEPSFDLEIGNRVLVSKMTDPGWVFLMSQASALVSEKGSLLSHTAIVGRELGIPVVVNVSGATTRIKTGDKLCVNGSKGTVEIENT